MSNTCSINFTVKTFDDDTCHITGAYVDSDGITANVDKCGADFTDTLNSVREELLEQVLNACEEEECAEKESPVMPDVPDQEKEDGSLKYECGSRYDYLFGKFYELNARLDKIEKRFDDFACTAESDVPELDTDDSSRTIESEFPELNKAWKELFSII